MIKVTGNEIYQVTSCLKNALGREPTMKDYNVFEKKAEKALNDILVTMGGKRVSAETLGVKLEIVSDLAKDYVDSIYNAFAESGNDIPKHLGDALFSIQTQLDEEDKPEPKTPAIPPTKEWTTFAYLRPDLVEEEDMPPLNNIETDEEVYLPHELMTTRFPCLQPDELEYQEYNMLIILPDGKMYGAKTIDFAFEDIPE